MNRTRRAVSVPVVFAIAGVAVLIAASGLAAATGFADGGFESGVLAGPFPTGPVPPSFGFWTRTTDNSHLVSAPLHSGQYALEVDTVASATGSAVYQDFDSGTLSYRWTLWVFPSDGINVAEVVYNWDRGTLGRAASGSLLLFAPDGTRFNGWNGNATFPAVPPNGWHEIQVAADRCTGTQEVRLDGAVWGSVHAVTAPSAGTATVILGDVANHALHGLYGYDDLSFDLYDCAAPPKNPCPLSQGFWKTHPVAWPVESLVLGDETYAKPDLLGLLRSAAKGDASLILARQLIAAKLNLANESDPGPIAQTVSDADVVLAGFSGRLPYGVAPSSGAGRDMTALSGMLDGYNNGALTPDCLPSDGEPPSAPPKGMPEVLVIVFGAAAPGLVRVRRRTSA